MSDGREVLIVLCLVAALTILTGFFFYIANRNRLYSNIVRMTIRESDQLVAGNEYAAVIFKAYRKFAANMKRYGLVRQSSETVRQYFARIERLLPVDRAALADFMDIFEEARYSDRVMGEGMRDACIMSLRNLQYSLEKTTLTEEQLALLQKWNEGAGRNASEIGEPEIRVASGSAARGAPDPAADRTRKDARWVISPPAEFVTIPEHAMPGKNREFVFGKWADFSARERMRDTLVHKFGQKNVTDGFKFPPEVSSELRKLLSRGNLVRLTDSLQERAEELPKALRLHMDPSIAHYLIEFGKGAAASMGRGEPPSTDTHINALLLAQVLALAEGRDYLIPDDIKLVLLGRGDRFYGPSSKTVLFVLEQELRSIEYPRSIILGEWKYLLPKKQYLVGIPVPMV